MAMILIMEMDSVVSLDMEIKDSEVVLALVDQVSEKLELIKYWKIPKEAMKVKNPAFTFTASTKTNRRQCHKDLVTFQANHSYTQFA